MSQHTINVLAKLAWNTELMKAIKFQIEIATMTGELYSERLPNTGEETVVWIGPDHDPHAFALFYDARPGVLWVDQLFTRDKSRRQGMARALMDCIEEHAKLMGYTAIEYGTRFENHASLGLASSLDYERVALTVSKKLPERSPYSARFDMPKDLNGDDIPF